MLLTNRGCNPISLISNIFSTLSSSYQLTRYLSTCRTDKTGRLKGKRTKQRGFDSPLDSCSLPNHEGSLWSLEGTVRTDRVPNLSNRKWQSESRLVRIWWSFASQAFLHPSPRVLTQRLRSKQNSVFSSSSSSVNVLHCVCSNMFK